MSDAYDTCISNDITCDCQTQSLLKLSIALTDSRGQDAGFCSIRFGALVSRQGRTGVGHYLAAGFNERDTRDIFL